ncbi:MAG: MBL fold metallo-hydrolase [Flavipsychrobacter sp.]|nr:MBL fold metallo-hydrolase [Flavipsychrobacter sp.]
MKEQLTHRKEKQSLYFQLAPDVWGTKDIFVNMYFIRNPEEDTWVLVDTGLRSSCARIRKVAAELFGEGNKPSCIVLTHGHFDHTGSLKRLAAEWQVPVYVHYLELPYLTGRSAYPPPDPSVGGGLMSSMSWMYPKKAINVEEHLRILPPDESVPYLPGWRYVYTPGHAPGHISLFRERDKVLIAGDALVTTRSEAVMSIMKQTKKISGPPKYFTYDWEAARNSVRRLADLNPRIVASGHGKPMSGQEMEIGLTNLAVHFDEEALPKKGRYLNDPAVADAYGVRYIPPREKRNNTGLLLLAVGLAAAAATYLILSQRKRARWA